MEETVGKKSDSTRRYFEILAGVHRNLSQDDCTADDHIQNKFQEFWDILEMDEAFKMVSLDGFRDGWLKGGSNA